MERVLERLRRTLGPNVSSAILRDEPLWRYTTLRVGGTADLFYRAETADSLAAIVAACQQESIPHVLLGGGSNVCVSDRGVRGLVILNASAGCDVGPTTRVDCGHGLMSLFLKSLSASLSGLEFAVGIPGSVGGALVSNAGAYRQNIDSLVRKLDVVEDGERKVVGPEWMEFSYRDSRLRRPAASHAALISVTLELAPLPRREILARARDNQRQRIFKQPWNPSAGSFFKNVCDSDLANRVPNLPEPLRRSGVVPAGLLSEACGCRGEAVGGALITRRHGNIFVNRGGATASDFRRLADLVRDRVLQQFGVVLEEEALYVGDWSGWNRGEEAG